MAGTFAQVAAARQNYESQLLKDPNIVGVGSGYKRRDGRLTDEPALIVYVVSKLPASRLEPHRLVPARFEFFAPLAGQNIQVASDVVQVDRVFALSHTGRYRPAPGGVSIGHPSVTAGTLGGYVQDCRTGELLLLSNNHVLAGQNSCQIGDPILQQGPLDGGTEQDVFARLARWVPLDFSPSGSNLVDAAVARPVDDASVDLSLMGLGFGPNASAAAQVGMRVQKSGRTTERTRGAEIISVDTTFWVDYSYGGARRACLRDAIVMLGSPGFSQPGDSGSLVLTDEPDPRVVGLLFAGNASGTFSLANHVQHVFNLLDVGLVSALSEVLRGTSWENRSDDLRALESKVVDALEQGKKYLDVLQRHNTELWSILRQEPQLRDVTRRLVIPLLNAFYTSAKPQDMVFDRMFFNELRALVEAISGHASLPLQKSLRWLYGELWRYEGKDIVGILKELKRPVPALRPTTGQPTNRTMPS